MLAAMIFIQLLIGAAYLFKKNQSELNGTVRLIFQPAEESGDGAKKVIDDGQLDGVEAIIGLHNKPDLPVGTIGLKEGPLMAAVDRFHIVLYGKGVMQRSHKMERIRLWLPGHLITALQTIVSRNVSPFTKCCIKCDKNNRWHTWNVIPGDVTLEGTDSNL